MGALDRTLKPLVLRILPRGLLERLKLYHYARKLRAVSDTTEPEFEILRLLVRPGDTVADIGANFGVYTKYLSSLVGGSGRVHSFEPIPLTYKILSSNIKKLSLRNVTARQLAISEKNATTAMEVPLYTEGGENYYMARVTTTDAPGDRPRVTVEAKTLDSIFDASSGPIAFIKCDAEGHELSCIRGALGLTARLHPAWLIEVSGDPDVEGSTACEVLSTLKSAGYGVYCQSGSKLRPRRRGDQSVNYFFLTPEQTSRLAASGAIES